MSQKSGKSHLCNVKCRKFCDGEQHVLVFMKGRWYANKCIVTYFRIYLFFCEKNDFYIKRDGSKSGKSHLCNVKCRKFCDGEQHVLVFVKVLWYANKCIMTYFRIYLFFCEKNDFCIKRDGYKIGKIALLQWKMKEVLRWRARRPGFCEGTLVCQQVYLDICSNSSFLLWKKWLLYQMGWLKNPENRTFAM